MNFAGDLSSFFRFLHDQRQKGRTPSQVPGPGENLVVDVISATGEALSFLYLGLRVETPESSNVAWIEYEAEEQRLVVQFNNTYTYEYRDITVELAYDFYLAVSKGKWVWNNLRALRRWYVFLYSLNGKEPVRMDDPSSSEKVEKRVKKMFARLRAPRFEAYPSGSYLFHPKRRKKAGLGKIRQAIRSL